MEEKPIVFHLLHKDELIYEVKIRGEQPVDSYPGLKTQIRELANKIPTDEIDSFLGDLSVEFQCIADKLVELSKLTADARLSLKNLNRIQALSNHLFHRLGRLQPTTPDDCELYTELNKKHTVITQRVDNLFRLYKSSQDLQDEDEPSSKHESTHTQVGQVVNVSCNRNKGVHTLNLKFNGKTSVVAFIERLEELCQSRHISNDELFASAIELFIEEASFWYRGVCNEVRGWSDLKKLLLEEYLPFDFDYRLMQEIRTRTQGPEENITIYLSIMKIYFNRLRKQLVTKNS
ncbi:uncharacterized protein [Choristoneura fumiferana]|uniref:uncharacterized protein n=1 Tax=Choristoneura fumiferana TaxID=7141 RepID=UPI003D157561